MDCLKPSVNCWWLLIWRTKLLNIVLNLSDCCYWSFLKYLAICNFSKILFFACFHTDIILCSWHWSVFAIIWISKKFHFVCIFKSNLIIKLLLSIRLFVVMKSTWKCNASLKQILISFEIYALFSSLI
jgi:hypothetical protein